MGIEERYRRVAQQVAQTCPGMPGAIRARCAVVAVSKTVGLSRRGGGAGRRRP